jgi:uncharacterized SAM-binding protein YcdF (DUF218 family)
MYKPSRKLILRWSAIVTLLALWLVWWIGWGAWPVSEPQELPWRPDVILVLGGGNEERPREAIRLHKQYPNVPLIVTGDGGVIYQALLRGGVDALDIKHESSATSTVENAQFTKAMLNELGARRVVLVTNWFHVSRALAVFRNYQPEREFTASFEAKPEELDNWHRYVSRRERLAALLYLVR